MPGWMMHACCCAGAVVLALAVTETQARPAPPGAMELVSGLAQHHTSLFDAPQRTELDELHRRMREADHQRRHARRAEARQEGESRFAEASHEALALLERCPRLIRVAIRDGGVHVEREDGPLVLSADRGGMLMRIEASGEGLHCTVHQYSLATHNGPVMPVGLGAHGTTWALVTLTEIPVQRTHLRVHFVRDGQPRLEWPVDVVAPGFGRLKVTILSDDTGSPTPAMVRLTSKTDGTDRRPSNALEFAPQFDNQGNPGNRRRSLYPGRLGGEFWVVPGPIDMMVPPGEWDIAIGRGVEHAGVFDTFTVTSGATVEKTYRPRRWVEMRKLGWYSGDDHVHCQILSDDDAERLMAWVQAEDLHVANVVKMGDIYRTWFEQRGWGPDYRVIDNDYILSPGQECPRTHEQLGHTIQMNTRGMVRDPDRYYLYDWVFDNVREQGGLTGYAHVLNGGFHVYRDMTMNIAKGKIDFVEIMQFAQLGTDLFYDFLNMGFRMTAAAGSDVPWGGTVGEVRLYAHVEEEPFTADAWFEAVRRGRTFVTNGPMIELTVDEAIPGDEITVRADRRLRVRARTWGHRDRVRPVRLDIVRHGDMIRSVTPDADDAYELTTEFEIDADHGCWIAARAEGHQGEHAHTSPVYVIREGFRFWKFEALDGLFEQRMAHLAQIEQIVAEAKRRHATGELERDHDRTQLAIQGDELLKRVAAARAIYDDLRQVAERERDRR